MNEHFRERLAPSRVGLLLALLTLVFGFGLGAVFGAAEDSLKGKLNAGAQAVLAEKYDGDGAKAKQVTDKSFTYLKRAHLHANGLGATATALILLLSFLVGSRSLKAVTAFLLGGGSLGYSMFWMLAGFRAPGMGGTGAAKESLEWLAIPTSGMCIVGLLTVLALFVRTAFFPKD